MQKNFIYKEIIETKNCEKIPVLKSGKTLESRYNATTEAERKLTTISLKEKVVLVLGLGSGILINKFIENFPDTLFLVLEFSNDDINFLSDLEIVKKIKLKSNCKIFSLENFSETLSKNYIPAFHGNLKIVEQNNWVSECESLGVNIKTEIENALEIIKRDFSVQSHFGKIWQHNIILNLKIATKEIKLKIPTEKTALVLAAGPTLNDSLHKFINEKTREEYFIIATDTAFSTSLNERIFPDAVVSIDGQLVSYNHFLSKKTSDTIFIFDLCANNSVTRKFQNEKILFSNTSHPLSELAQKNQPDSFINLFSGSGTVTIAALSFALKLGFSKIKILGADFSYPNHKPYAKGTYLDSLYNINSCRFFSSEKQFVSLMYRTPLLKNESKITTEVLESYKKSLEDYLNKNNVKYKFIENVYFVENNNIEKKKSNEICFSGFNFSSLKKEIQIQIEKNDKNLEIALLPFVANLRMKYPEKEYGELLKLAQKNLTAHFKIEN